MPELFLHYIWQHRLFQPLAQQTTDGRRVEVLDVGRHNTDAGPDFFAATIRIDGMQWVGNVELHVLASDWYRHGHDTDKAYDTVVLHVVKKADKEVRNSRGELIPQCELQYPYEPECLAKMLSDTNALCEFRLQEKPAMLTADWLRTLTNERLQRKTDAIRQLLDVLHGNWEEAFYITLAHNFGFHTNGVPFEMLAKQTPLSYLLKHRNSLFQLQAMLLGQSGLLNADTARTDEDKKLLKEYLFLQKKFALQPLSAALWKRLRMRPQSFPEVRIRQFATLLHEREMLLRTCLETQGLQQLRDIFRVASSPVLGTASVDILLINSVVPYRYAWGAAHNDFSMRENALTLLSDIPPESNNIIKQWKMLGIAPHSAADTQALLQLHQEYCQRHRCRDCNIGYQITSDL